MISFMKHPDDLVLELRDDRDISGRSFGRFVSYLRKMCEVVPEPTVGQKTVLVETLKQGDTFVFDDFCSGSPYVYIVTEVSQSCVEVTSFSGKVFSCGRKVKVVPVDLSIAVKFREV